MPAAHQHPYGSGLLGASPNDPLRPGGLELTRTAIASAKFCAGQRVLDLGCGTGASTDLLSHVGCQVVGVDATLGTLEVASRQHPDLAWVLASAEALPFLTASQNGILAECSLSVVAARTRALSECHRVLAPGSMLVITDVYAREPDAVIDNTTILPACVAQMAGQETLCAEITQAGFKIESWQDHSAVLKTFLARLIFEKGSLAALWSNHASRDEASNLSAALRAKRPGYFLLLARAT